MHARTVLLIDSDSDSLNIYSLLLQHHGFRVLTATEAEQGMCLAREQQPDVLIVEPFFVPSKGEPVLEALRNDESTAHLPLLLVTAVPVLLQVVGEELRRQRLLVKPCEPARLLEEVERLLTAPLGAEA